MNPQNNRIWSWALVGVLVIAVVAVSGSFAYSKLHKEEVFKTVKGDATTKQYCKNTAHDGLKLANGDTVTVSQLVRLAGTPALKDPASFEDSDAWRKKLNEEQPYYTSGLHLSLVGVNASPTPIEEAHKVVRDVMIRAREGKAPVDKQVALDAAGKIDKFIAEKCAAS